MRSVNNQTINSEGAYVIDNFSSFEDDDNEQSIEVKKIEKQ